MASCLSGCRSQLMSEDKVGDMRAAVRMFDIDCCPEETMVVLEIGSIFTIDCQFGQTDS